MPETLSTKTLRGGLAHKLFILIRAQRTSISAVALASELVERGLNSASPHTVLRTLRAFARKGLLKEQKGKNGIFTLTRLGNRVATEARLHLKDLVRMFEESGRDPFGNGKKD